ncbi:hypothetical protein D3C76_53080 [compost metagenome]
MNLELSERMLKSNGWAYQFDLSPVEAAGDDSAVNEHIRQIYLSAIDVLTKQRSKKILQGPFLLWNCLMKLSGNQNQFINGYVLIVTPFFHQVTGRDSNPLVESMWGHKGYIRTTSANPLLEGAVPACLFQEGIASPIELDEELISRLSDLFEEHQYMLSLTNPEMTIRSNPYLD